MLTDTRIVVTGAGGALGRLVCQALLSAGHKGVVAGSRMPAKLGHLAAAGAIPVLADFDQPFTLEAAFAGASQALIISTDALTVPGHRLVQHAAALAAALRQQVGHLVYTSMPDPARSVAIPFAADHAAMEEGLRHSGRPWTSLRNSWYQENLLAYLPQIVRDGTWFTAAGAGRIAFVAREDAAAAAAAVLATHQDRGVMDVAGPQALTIDDIAAVVAHILGRSLRVVHTTPDVVQREMLRQGVDPVIVGMVSMTEANQRAGHFDVSGVELNTLLGRAPRPLESFVKAHQRDLLAPGV
ncbi:NAD(P)H-binding protein [Roseateles chitinivorans]|uniref:NmrA family NAD(P)-binding protein n=1 Tax=Roseateles chitinivorans TaxID=2917965 RepID=UPI003D6755AA